MEGSVTQVACALLVLIATACQMSHLERPVAEPDPPPETERAPETTSGETAAPALPNTPGAPENPAPAGSLPTLTIADVSAGEAAGALTFTVSLTVVSGAQVTVRYATENGTATAGADYDAASGTLTFAADSTVAQTIRVTVTDDAVAEGDETFTMRLHDPRGATLADGEATATINDDDDDARAVRVQPTALTLYVGGSAATYTVVLTAEPTAEVAIAATVSGSTAISVTPTELRFTAADWASGRTVTVTAAAAALEGDTATIRHTVSGGDYAGEAVSVTVTIAAALRRELPALELGSLQVTGGGTMYPDFAGGVHHYGVTCADGATLQVTAQALSSAAQVTLLRADPDDNQVSLNGNLDVAVAVGDDTDIAIELSAAGDTITYVVHCIPAGFPDINILKKTEDASDGLLLVTPHYVPATVVGYVAIVDNNGVPRFRRYQVGENFRRHADGPLIDGKRVRYSISLRDSASLLDEQFEVIGSVQVVAPLTSTDYHDFLITDEGNYLFISYQRATRDLCAGEATSCPANVLDSVIQEVTPTGIEVFRWNSWDHLKLADCQPPGDYAHLNSLYLAGSDIIASFPHCSQVLRIDRPSGAVVWQMGGSTPLRNPDTQHLPIVNDDEGEFCGQHQATLTAAGTIVLFDNGNNCLGARKEKSPQLTRVVEYDISSGTQAAFMRDFTLGADHGHTVYTGGVTVLENGHWLIAWGGVAGRSPSLGSDETIAVSEVDPDRVTGSALFHMNMWGGGWDFETPTYRVYREPEADVKIPWNLP